MISVWKMNDNIFRLQIEGDDYNNEIINKLKENGINNLKESGQIFYRSKLNGKIFTFTSDLPLNKIKVKIQQLIKDNKKNNVDKLAQLSIKAGVSERSLLKYANGEKISMQTVKKIKENLRINKQLIKEEINNSIKSKD